MIRLSDEARERVWHPFPNDLSAEVRFCAATALDVDLAKAVAEEMARQLVTGGEVMADLGLTAHHSGNFIKTLLASQENPDAGNKIYERFLTGVALAEQCVTSIKNIEAADGHKLDHKSRADLAALLRDPSRCAEWRAWVLAPEIMEIQAGNASSAVPNGNTASAAISAKGAPTSATSVSAAGSTPTAKPDVPEKPKNHKPSKKPSSGAPRKTPGSGDTAAQA